MKTGFWCEYLAPSGMRMGSGEASTMKSFVVCTVHLNIVRAIKSRRLNWEGHVARVEESSLKMLTSKHIGKWLLGKPSVNGRTMSE